MECGVSVYVFVLLLIKTLWRIFLEAMLNSSLSLELVKHPAFDCLRVVELPHLQATFAEYRHRVTGARHLHLAADNPENVFLVAFKTMPEDSRGVAHILEHTALCGSEKYPVRDPFFLMIRRSLNTFMNAFTASDWTAYPFASTNSQDFDNLLSVYLDAAFFPHLHELDFAQEGIRREFASDAADAPLVYKGVVFNEMKGAMSSAHSVLYETLNHYLFPTTTYHNNSGGDPAHIPDLTHDDLLAFHRRHYHPSNAVFMTFGDEPVLSLQTRFQDQALGRFNDVATPVLGRDEKRYVAPLSIEAAYAPESDEGPQTHHVMGWLLGSASDTNARFEAHLLSGVLLENSASPLRAALETSELGQAPSGLCGVDDNSREMTFLCGLEGSEPERAVAVEALIIATLEQVARDGMAQADVEAVLHQFELSQREIGGDSYPYGLQLLLNGLSPALQEADPIAVWHVEPALARLRESIKDPRFVPDLVQRLLLDNPHRVRLTLRPDAELSTRRDALEASQLAAERARLSDADCADIRAQTEALKQRQEEVPNTDILPKVTLADVPAQAKALTGERAPVKHAELPLTTYAQGTNGLFYEQVIIELPHFSARQTQLLPLYTSVFAELGAGEQDYKQLQQRQSAVTGGLRMSLSARTTRTQANVAQAHLIVSGKALSYNQGVFQQLLDESLFNQRFDEVTRIGELLAQLKGRWEGSVTGQGHALAMGVASRGMSALAAFQQSHSGLFGIRFLRELHSANDLTALAAELSEMHSLVLAMPRQLLMIAEPETLAQASAQAQSLWVSRTAAVGEAMPWVAPTERVNEAWLTQTQVHFCAKAYPAVPTGHADAPALMALGGILRNGFLHRAIREQGGAYGGGASYDGNSCAFRFFSYRDPRLTETLADFDASLDWLHSQPLPASALEEVLLGVFADLDKPMSPAGEARQDFHQQLYGRTLADRQSLREKLLALTSDDIIRVAGEYLRPELAQTAVIAPTAASDQVAALGLSVQKL